MLLLIFILKTIIQPISAYAIAKPTLAITPTLIATTSADLSPTVTPDSTSLTEIQKIREAVQQKVKEKLSEIVALDTTKKRGVYGNISTISASTITLTKDDNSTIQINTDDTTAFIDINRKKIDITKLKTGQSILVMGYNNNDGSLAAKRIVVNDPSYLPVKKIITMGKIVDRSQATNVALIVPLTDKNTQYQVSLVNATTIVDSTNKKLAIKDVTVGKKVIAILSPSAKNKTYTTDKIIIF